MNKKIIIVLSVIIVSVIATMPLEGPPISKTKLSKFFKESTSSKQISYRLSRDTEPRVYIIDFDPDFMAALFTFKGNSTIFFEVLRPTSSVILHRSSVITVDKDFTELIDENKVSTKPESQIWDAHNEFFTITFPNLLEPGNYTLKMKWTGRDTAEDWFAQRKGFFRAYDKVNNFRKKYLITTHFEPSGARSAFPCWDEPGFKAEFEISIKHFPNYTALSNMPAISLQQLPDGRIMTQFARSLKMSPYLPCVVVADYKSIKNSHGNITFYGLEKNLESLRFALEISEKVIPAMEAYTDIPYAMSKLDQITIPQYDGAMEHWGLISYQTKIIVLDNSTLIPDILRKDKIISVVAHEIAHQWFGNLVSPVWWDDIWLNEAFAAYFQSRIIDQIYPNWNIMDFFVIQTVDRESYEVEMLLPKPKPIKWSPEGKVSLYLIFNPVTYRKGAAVIHMFEHILTEEVFRAGVQRYLKKNQFTSVVTDDLWRSFQEVYDERFGELLNIKETMDPWIEQTGTPIVNVTRNYETGETILTQKNLLDENSENKWRIPINWATKTNPDFSHTAPTIWMEVDQEVTAIPDVKTDDWIIVNIQQRGFYRVNYDRENWRRIAEYLNSDDYKKIHVVNRAQLVDDIFRLYLSDNSYLEILVNITSYLYRETDYLPWIPATNIILEMIDIMRNTPEKESFEIYMLYLTNGITEKLGFENRDDDDHSAIRIRSILAPFVCSFGHVECRLFTSRVFSKYLENPSINSLPDDDWQWIVCNGLKTSNESLREKYLATELEPDIKRSPQLTFFVQCINDYKLKEEYLSSLVNANSTIDSEFIDDLFSELLARKIDDVNFVLNYFVNHFEDIKEFYEKTETGKYLLTITRLAEEIRTEDQYEKFKKFIGDITPAVKIKSSSHISMLESLLDQSLKSINQSKLYSGKFNELVEKRFLEPNIIDIGRGLKEKS